MEAFRKELSKYVDSYAGDKDLRFINPKVTILPNGHVLDHHILGYFAPFSIKRMGFKKIDQETNNIYHTPKEQLLILNNQLMSRGIRFIYVPMPCKIAVYPELAVSKNVIPKHGVVIPQWRNFTKEVLSSDIEVIDCYKDFKRSNEMLFSKNHHLSPAGAKMVGKIVANYINKTTNIKKRYNFLSKDDVLDSPIMYHSGNDNSREIGIEHFKVNRVFVEENGQLVNYSGYYDSEIAIIGDCNIQSYRGFGCDVTSYISNTLKYPVKYIGRYLPFANVNTIDKILNGTLADTKILLYVGFVSASFVRAPKEDICWGTRLIKEGVFIRNGAN